MENNITYHLQNIFKTEELEESRTTQKIRVVQNEGTRKVSREVIFYSLDTIIAVGYIVNSKELINILKEYIIKEFALNK
ncbi:MAG: RhuM family protein [Bacilli bacterium]